MTTRRILTTLGLAAAAALALGAVPAQAALTVGAAAPDFTTDAALAGVASKFSLQEALKKGPVVLYFYPKAFTSGCTVEAHEFAEATPKFNAMGATVVGISTDNIDTLKKFSVEACRNKFAVLADEGAKITKQYDASLAMVPGMSDRISYVITPNGKVLYVHAAMSPEKHVANTMKAVEDWKAAGGK